MLNEQKPFPATTDKPLPASLPHIDSKQDDEDEFATTVREHRGRRLKIERRRHIDPTTCERDYTADEVEFMKAMDDYKRRSGRQFPTWSEVLEVVRGLGYNR